MKQRNLYLDVIKGFAIILVVYGHCLQYGSTLSCDKLYFDDWVFKAIYSFHMPLFMLVSGYLFYGSVSRHSTKHIVKTRFTSLLVPIIIWNTLDMTINSFLLSDDHQGFTWGG